MSSAEESDGEVLPGFAEVVRWTKAEMVLWLQRHHLPKSGRNKEVLARRIVRHMVGEESSDEEDEDIEEVCHPKIPLCPGKFTVTQNMQKLQHYIKMNLFTVICFHKLLMQLAPHFKSPFTALYFVPLLSVVQQISCEKLY